MRGGEERITGGEKGRARRGGSKGRKEEDKKHR
jgi:hypothetical protein